MDVLSRFCCQNPECPDYGRRGAGNLTVCMRYGREKQARLLYCRTCKDRFSEYKGTALFRLRLGREKAISVLSHLLEGCGQRKICRLTGVSRTAVARLSKLAGDHAKALHDEIVAFSPKDRRGATRRKMGLRGKKTKEL